MLEPLLGNLTMERVLLFLAHHQAGYPREIAGAFGIHVNAVQQQLRRLEEGGIVVSRLYGRVRLYELNPRYPFSRELRALLESAIRSMPREERERYFREKRGF